MIVCTVLVGVVVFLGIISLKKIKELKSEVVSTGEKVEKSVERTNVLENHLSTVLFQQQLLFSTLQKQSEKLDVDASDWVIHKDGVKKTFEPGVLKKVSTDGEMEIQYKASENETVISETRSKGVLTHEMVFSKFGAPLSGKAFNSDGGVVAEYSYDALGQVEKVD